MIHYTAYYGSSIISSFGDLAVSSTTQIIPMLNVTYGQVISNMFGTTSNLLESQLDRKDGEVPMFGGGVFDSGIKVAINSDDIAHQVIGTVSTWMAGGIAYVVEKEEEGWIKYDPDFILTDFVSGQNGKTALSGDTTAIQVEIDTTPPPTLGESYEVVDLKTVCEWARNLDQVEDSKLAMAILTKDEEIKYFTHGEIAQYVQNQDQDDSLDSVGVLKVLKTLLGPKHANGTTEKSRSGREL